MHLEQWIRFAHLFISYQEHIAKLTIYNLEPRYPLSRFSKAWRPQVTQLFSNYKENISSLQMLMSSPALSNSITFSERFTFSSLRLCFKIVYQLLLTITTTVFSNNTVMRGEKRQSPRFGFISEHAGICISLGFCNRV